MRTVGWPLVPLMDVCSPKQWPTIPQTEFTESGFPVYGANGQIGYYNEFNHEKPTVLITCRGATCGTINVCAERSYVTGNSMALDNLDESRVDLRFLVYALQNGSLSKAISGTAQPQITRQGLSAISVPVPPLPEQRRIAEILDKADALRAKRRASLAQLDTLTQSIFLDMFGDPVTNPKEWHIASLGELISVGPQNGLYRPASDYGTGTPILRIDSFYDGVVTGLATLKRVRLSSDEIRLYGVRPDEIVVNRVNSREYLGKSALIPELAEPTVFESNMMRFGVDRKRLNPIYLIQLLQSRNVRAHVLRASKDAVNQSSINQQDVKSIPVGLPPLPQQELFASYVRSSRRLRNVHRYSRVQLDALFASLQHRAFAGAL